MAKKLVALFVMCVIAVAALRGCEAAEAASASAKFKNCFTNCQKDCQTANNGYTFCEVKCDEECTAKEDTDKLNGLY